jgi:hypothetical protein
MARTPAAAAELATIAAAEALWPRSPSSDRTLIGSFTTVDTVSPAVTVIRLLAASTVSSLPMSSTT